MIRGLYTAASGMLAQQMMLDAASHNLANIETTGYKKDVNVLSPFGEELMHFVDSSSSPKDKKIGTIDSGAQVEETATAFTQGDLEETGNNLDVAIQGDGFFVVQDGQTVKLTRNGSFSVDSGGYLCTGEGYRVVGEDGFIVANGGEINIDAQGEVYEDGLPISKLLVVDFEDRSQITKAGDTLFNAPMDAAPVVPEYNLRPGFLERSNVDVSQEMVNLVTFSRTYAASSKMVQTLDEILDMAVREIGSLT